VKELPLPRGLVTSEERALRFRQTGPPSSRSPGYRGLSWDQDQGAWRARIRVSGGRRHLGFFPDAKAAARAWDSAAQAAWGKLAYKNLPKTLEEGKDESQ
jgi:hypothetical protein